MKLLKQFFRFNSIIALFLAICFLALEPAYAKGPSAQEGVVRLAELSKLKLPQYRKDITKPDLILIPAAKGWLVSLYAPYIGLLKSDNQLPGMLGLSDTLDYQITELNRFTRQKTVESLVEPPLLKKIGFKATEAFLYTTPQNTPSQTAFDILRRYVVSSPDVVITTLDDIEEYIQASVFAAHFQLPLIPIEPALANKTLVNGLQEFKVERVILISNAVPANLKALKNTIIQKVQPQQVPSLLVEKIGNDQIKNVLLTSVADILFINHSLANDAVFYLPYISYLRNAPVVFSPETSGVDSEKVLNNFLTGHHLKPRNITIVGNYGRIASIEPDEEFKKTVYDKDIELEPGTNYKNNQAVAYGIGRLPFNNLSQISTYYTRLRLHDEYYSQQERDFVMISNLIAKEGATLKFAEAISKLTVKELRNFGIKGKTFYATEPEDDKIWKASLKSGLIVYEGHSNHFLALSAIDQSDATIADSAFFNKNPLLIMQSCNSLDDIDYLVNHGPIGVVGSSTRVHSASGSSFIKAYLDNTLYQSMTLGEALRDAKNYFLSVVALKKHRGHIEQSKTKRVALSFRVWGDPEIKIFPRTLAAPEKKPVSIQIRENNVIEIKTPEKFFNRVENEKYHLKSFPMAKQAGIVKTSKNSLKTGRRIESFYFFKLPYEDLKQYNLAVIHEQFRQGDVRNNILEDPLKRWIYFLHYPKKETKNSLLQIKLK